MGWAEMILQDNNNSDRADLNRGFEIRICRA